MSRTNVHGSKDVRTIAVCSSATKIQNVANAVYRAVCIAVDKRDGWMDILFIDAQP